jgi:hypothetical protein
MTPSASQLRLLGLRKILVATPSTCKFFNCNFHFIFLNCNFYFIYALLYTRYYFYYAPFIYCIYCNVYYTCSCLFAPAHYYSFLTFFNQNLNHSYTVRKDFAPSEHCLYWPVISSLLPAEKIFVISHFWCEDENRHL